MSERAMKGGGATKRASRLIYIIPSTYTVENSGFINFEQLNTKAIMANTNLTNQRQVFVEEVCTALEITWKLQRRLDTKTLIHYVIRLVSSAESDSV